MKIVNPPINKFRGFLIIFGIFATACFYLFKIQGTAGSIIITTLSLVALLTLVYAIHSLISSLGGGTQQSGFKLIYWGAICTTIGQLLFGVMTTLGLTSIGGFDPSFLFIVTYILIFLGFLVLAINAHIHVRDFIGTIVGFGIMGLSLLTIASELQPVSYNFINLAFVFGDFIRIIVVGLVLQMVIIYQGGLLGRYWLSIFVGNFFIIIGNFSSAILSREYYSGMWPYTLINLIFIGAYLFVAHGYYGIGDSIRVAQKMIRKQGEK